MKILLFSLIILFISCTYKDIPFQDVFAEEKWTTSDEEIADWNKLPIEKNSGVSLFSFQGGKYYLLLSTSSLWIGERIGKKYDKEIKETMNWARIDIDLKIKISEKVKMIETEGKFLIAGDGIIIDGICEGMNCKVINTIGENIGYINEVTEALGGGLWLATKDNGLLLYKEKQIKKIEGMEDISINSVKTFRFENEIYIACGGKKHFYLFTENKMNKIQHFWIGNHIDKEVSTIGFDEHEQKIWIGNIKSISTFDMTTRLFERIGGRKGLPVGNITTIKYTEKRIFVGTKIGMCVYNREKKYWYYYYHDRWIHGNEIKSIDFINKNTIDGNEGILILADEGASLIKYKIWTLQDKSNFFEDMVRPRHDRYGLVSDCLLTKYGDLRSYQLDDSDNDGSWTGYYMLGKTFEYAVTKTEESKKHAIQAFEAMQLLNNVTGTKGFMARSVLPVETKTEDNWKNSTVYPWLKFKIDTSSDEVSLHILAFAIFYDLIDDEEFKKKAYILLDNIMSYIVDNDFYLIDPTTGKHTKWGVWNPKDLNYNKYYYDDRPLNSLEILSWLLNVYRITKKQKYLDAFFYLVNEHGYLENIRNIKIECPDDINHSDDHLTFLGYMSLFYALDHLPQKEFDIVRNIFVNSVERSWKYIENEKATVFDFIHAISKKFTTKYNDLPDVTNAIETLKRWPQDLIEWPTKNSHRIDIPFNPEPYIRKHNEKNENMRAFPPTEVGMFRFNHNWYRLDDGNGLKEYDPGAFHYAYWLGRYYGLIVPLN